MTHFDSPDNSTTQRRKIDSSVTATLLQSPHIKSPSNSILRIPAARAQLEGEHLEVQCCLIKKEKFTDACFYNTNRTLNLITFRAFNS